MKMYILRTRGDSMIEAGIEEGDYVVIKKAAYRQHRGNRRSTA